MRRDSHQPEAAPVRALLRLARQGGALYQAKAAEAEHAGIQALCRQMAEGRAALAGRLSRLPGVVAPDATGTFDFEAVAEDEAALLRAFEQALARHDSRALRQAFKHYLPQPRACSEQLQQLAQAPAAAKALAPLFLVGRCRRTRRHGLSVFHFQASGAAQARRAASMRISNRTMEVLHVNEQIVKGKLKQLSGKIKAKWGELTDDDIQQAEGNREYLLGKLQEKYGLTKEKAEAQVRELLG